MPTMVPGIALWASLQPFVIAVGNIILITVLVLSIVTISVSFGYILMREWGWWRDREELPRAPQTQND